MFKITPIKLIILIIILAFLAANAFFAFKYFAMCKELKTANQLLEGQKSKSKIVDFTGLFIEKVLKAEGEIDFDTRFQLESAVRDLNDKEILGQWQKFIESQNEFTAQREVKNLLSLLVLKIK